MQEQPGQVPADRTDPLDYYQGINPKVFQLLPPHCARILEVGCASGVLGKMYKQENPGVFYVGIERFEAAYREAVQCLDAVFLADVEIFDWSRIPGDKFDCIVFADVLEHLVDPGKVLQVATRLLAPGGCVVCCVPNVGHWSIISGLMQGKWDYADSGVLDKTHLRFFTIRTFQALLEKCGLRPVSEDRWCTPPILNDFILPLLKAMGIDANAFEDRTSTLQWVVKAQRVEDTRPIVKPVSRKSVTLVVSAGGGLARTRACLASIAETYPERAAPRVMVVDDASGDGTAAFLEEAARKYPWLTSLRSASAMGPARSRNRGAGLADSDILVFLEGNSQVKAGWLDAMLDRIDDGGVGIVGSQLIYPNGAISHAGMVLNRDAMLVPFHRFARQNDEEANLLRVVPAVSGACLMIHRKLFLDIGGFSTDLPMFYADLDLCFKARQKGCKILYQPGSKVIHPDVDEYPDEANAENGNPPGRMVFMQKWKDFILKQISEQPRFYAVGMEYWSVPA
jgi:O-antigen biosynthesis protein